MLAFNFASRRFAYRRLAQSLSRPHSSFSSFLRYYVDPVIKANQCPQAIDNIGIADENPQHLLQNLKAVFACIQKAGLKHTKAQRHF